MDNLIIPDKIVYLTSNQFYESTKDFYEENKAINFDTFILLHSTKLHLTVAEYSPNIFFINVNGVLFRLFKVGANWYSEAYIQQQDFVSYAVRNIENLDNFITFIVNTSIRYNKS